MIDAVVSTVYRNTILSKTSTIPGYVAKLAEDKKFKADEKSPEPVSSKHGGDHVFVPFAMHMEDGGTLGAHAFGAPEDAGRVCSCSGLLLVQLPGQPLSAHSPHAGLALDAALAAAPFHLAPCQPFPADSAPLPACRDSLCKPLALLRAELS